MSQEKINAAWDEILKQYNLNDSNLYLWQEEFSFLINLAKQYRNWPKNYTDPTEEVQYITHLSPDEALMFYAFVILAEGWEIPS